MCVSHTGRCELNGLDFTRHRTPRRGDHPMDSLENDALEIYCPCGVINNLLASPFKLKVVLQ